MAENQTKKSIEPLSPQLKAVIAITKESTHDSFFGTGFSIEEVAQKAVFRGMTGEAIWTQPLLEKIISPYQKHVASNPTEPQKIDSALTLLSTKINVNIDRVRRCFYGIPEPVSVAPAPVDLPEVDITYDEQ
jgi:hypothetical protein